MSKELLLLLIVLCVIQGDFAKDCLQYSSPVSHRFVDTLQLEMNSSLKTVTPLRFRHHYDSAKYKLEVDPSKEFRLIILPKNGSRRDTLKGGGLSGSFSYAKTVINLVNINGHKSLDLWNLYFGERHEAVALQVTFHVGPNWNSKWDPLLKSVSKLNPDRSTLQLPFNFNINALFPSETRLALYNTTAFPFHLVTNASSECGPVLETFLFLPPLEISLDQWYLLESIAARFGKTVESRSESGQIQNVGTISYIAAREHSVFRRMIVEAHSLEGEEIPDLEDYEDYEDEVMEKEEEEEDHEPHENPIVPHDEELFPKDCEILYSVFADFEGKRANQSNTTTAGTKEGSKVEYFWESIFIGVLLSNQN